MGDEVAYHKDDRKQRDCCDCDLTIKDNSQLKMPRRRRQRKRHSKSDSAFFKISSWLFQLSQFVKCRRTRKKHIQVQKEKEKCVFWWGVRGGGGEGGGEGGKGVYKFSSQIFFGDLSFLDLGGGGVVVWVFLVGLSSEFLGLSSKVWVF